MRKVLLLLSQKTVLAESGHRMPQAKAAAEEVRAYQQREEKISGDLFGALAALATQRHDAIETILRQHWIHNLLHRNIGMRGPSLFFARLLCGLNAAELKKPSIRALLAQERLQVRLDLQASMEMHAGVRLQFKQPCC